jgi:hypothetical protein
MAKSKSAIGCNERKTGSRLTEESGIGIRKFRLCAHSPISAEWPPRQLRRASVNFMGVHLTGVYLMGIHFMGMHLMGVHLTKRASHRRAPRGRASQGRASRACTSWACTSQACTSRACTSWRVPHRRVPHISVHLIGMYLINVHPTDVYLMGVYLTGVHLMKTSRSPTLQTVVDLSRSELQMEVFYEDLARQDTVAHLSQLQVWFRRCHIWVFVRVWSPVRPPGSNSSVESLQ